MKSIIVGLGDDVDENAIVTMRALGLSENKIKDIIDERNHHVASEEEILVGFRKLFLN